LKADYYLLKPAILLNHDGAQGIASVQFLKSLLILPETLGTFGPQVISTLYAHSFDSSGSGLVIGPTVLLVLHMVMKILKVNAGREVLELIFNNAMTIGGQVDDNFVAKECTDFFHRQPGCFLNEEIDDEEGDDTEATP
jgi:hypothetical protein